MQTTTTTTTTITNCNYQLQMRTIFSCMWPSCSVNCGSLDDIERHVRAHLGCKQYESIGDEDFYYEETEVDELTYWDILDHCPIGSPKVASQRRYQNHHHHHHNHRHNSNNSHPFHRYRRAGEQMGASGVTGNGGGGGGGPIENCSNARGTVSPSHNSDGLSSGQSFSSSSPATSPVCSSDSSPPSSASSSSSLSYPGHSHHQPHLQGAHSAARSIDWNEFLASSSQMPFSSHQFDSNHPTPQQKLQKISSNLLSAQQLIKANELMGNGVGVGNNNNKWPAGKLDYSRANFETNPQEVYLMHAIVGQDQGHRVGNGRRAKVAAAQPITCDANSTSSMNDLHYVDRWAFGNRKRLLKDESDKCNSNHRKNQLANSRKTKSPPGSRVQTGGQRNRSKLISNQKNQNEMSSSSSSQLQFSMQLSGQNCLEYGARGAIYEPNCELSKTRDNQRTATGNARHRQSASAIETGNALHQLHSGHQSANQLDDQCNRAHSLRRGRKPSAKRAAAESDLTAAVAGKRRQKATAASKRTPTKTVNINEHHHHHQQQQHYQKIFQLKHQNSSSKSLAIKTITKTSRPSNAGATSNSPTTGPAAVPQAAQGDQTTAYYDHFGRPLEVEDDEDDQGHYLNPPPSSSSPSSSSSSSSSLSANQVNGASGPPAPAAHRRVRGENRKCRKVYGMERRDQWCTQCKWKKACTRFSATDGRLLFATNSN